VTMPTGTTHGTVSFAAYLTDVDSPVDPDDLPELVPISGRVRILRSVPITLFASAAPGRSLCSPGSTPTTSSPV